MNFEKRAKKHIKRTLDKYVPKLYRKARFPLWIKIFVPSFSLLTVAAISLMFAFQFFNKTNKKGNSGFEIKYVNENEYYYQENEYIVYLKSWEEKNIIEKYHSFNFKGITYSFVSKRLAPAPISETNINKKIDDCTIVGYDELKETTEEERTTTIGIYSIKDLNESTAIAVKFDGIDGYYSFFNYNLQFATMKDIFDKLSPEKIIDFTYSYYPEYQYDDGSKHYIRFDNFDDSMIYELLFDDLTLENKYISWEQYKGYYHPFIRFKSNSTYLGINDSNLKISFSLNEHGYLFFWAPSSKVSIFNVGVDRVKTFVNYLENNVKGYELIFSPTPTPY